MIVLAFWSQGNKITRPQFINSLRLIAGDGLLLEVLKPYTQGVCAFYFILFLFYMFYFVLFWLLLLLFWQRNSHIVESVPKVFLSLFYFIFIFLECIFIFISIFEIFKESTSLGRFQVFCSQYHFKSISICLSIFFQLNLEKNYFLFYLPIFSNTFF